MVLFVAFVSTVLFLLCPLSSAQTIVIDGRNNGKVFEGVGAISGGGGNSRLLIDYLEPYRSQILDYLFKPHYGANLQILKVEIGADMDSTDGSEPSHMHTRADENYNGGYEWWLMEQAKARNPEIKLAALPWGAPHWVGNGNYWSRDMIDYIIKWLKHAESDHHLKIDYIGGRNENGWDVQWYKDLRAALRANGFASIKVIASDDWEKDKVWAVASDMKRDADLNDAIDIVGCHGPGWGVYPTADALSIGKPLWDSESHFDDKRTPYNQVARILNRNYLNGQVVSTMFWPVISAIYDNLPFDNVGLIKSNEPWSGHYVITRALWAMAHTTQFTEPGWHYIGSSSGFLNGDTTGAHGSFLILKSPNASDYTTVIETVDSKEAQTVQFRVSGFPKKVLHVWTSDLTSVDPSNWFVKLTDIRPVQGQFSLRLQPGRVYTLTTTMGQRKGDAVAPASATFPLPYADNFEGCPLGKSPRYFSDVYGMFETAHCAGSREGICLRQVVPEEPIAWKKTANRPFTMLGNLDWSDYHISSDILLEEPGSVDLIGRLSGMSYTDVPNSYLLRVSNTGSWSLLKTTTKEKEEETTLATGQVTALGINQWHNLTLTFQGKSISAKIDRVTVQTLTDSSFEKGMAGLGVVGYVRAQFDNFKVEPVQTEELKPLRDGGSAFKERQ